jgi:cytidylate kinase
MILAIYGKSCSGKTILSKNLMQQLSINVRHCGEIVKALAAQRGISPGQLTVEDHMSIDEETRREAETQNQLIIEGCFLDKVVGRSECILIELQCNYEVRKFRYQQRNSSLPFETRGKNDQELRSLLYGDALGRLPDFTVDTTKLLTEETVMEVRNWLQIRQLLP